MHARTHIVCLDIVYKYISGEMSNSEKPLCEQQEKENEKADVEAVCTRVGICAFVLHAYVCEASIQNSNRVDNQTRKRNTKQTERESKRKRREEKTNTPCTDFSLL